MNSYHYLTKSKRDWSPALHPAYEAFNKVLNILTSIQVNGTSLNDNCTHEEARVLLKNAGERVELGLQSIDVSNKI